jgi:hypothetical protein
LDGLVFVNWDFSDVVFQFDLYLALALVFWGLLLLITVLPLSLYAALERKERERPSPEIEEMPTSTIKENKNIESELSVADNGSELPPKVDPISPSDTNEIPLPDSTTNDDDDDDDNNNNNNNNPLFIAAHEPSNSVDPLESPDPSFIPSPTEPETDTNTNITAPPPPERTEW